MSRRMPNRVPCYWCGVLFWKRDLTNDHVVPLGHNGPDVVSNIVRACEDCNLERGYIVSAFSHCRTLGFTQPDRAAMIDRFMPTLIEARRLQAKWAVIEKERLGRSPSLDMLLAIPAVAKVGMFYGTNLYKSALAKARKVAEDRFKAEPTQDEIAVRAYHIWLAGGCQHGRDVEHWLRAKQELGLK